MNSEEINIETFFEKAKEGKLFASLCLNCGKLSLPPRKICPSCFSNRASWKELKNEGIIESYTVIHVAPKRLEKEVPYTVCLVKLDEGLKMLVRMKTKEEVKIGDRIKIIVVDSERTEWPNWPYFLGEKL